MAVLLALCSALAYGLSDFVGGIVSRRTPAWAVAFVGQTSSTLCTAVVAAFVHGGPSERDLGWAVVAGIGSGIGTGFLYRGFASGRMSVVAPVSAVGAAAVPVLAGYFTGERPAAVVWFGILTALPGIWLVSGTPGSHSPQSRARSGGRVPDGLVDAVLAGLGFGTLFAALAQIPADAGLWPLTLAQALSVPTVVLLALSLGGQWVPRGRRVRWAVLAGPLGSIATGSFLLATQHGYLTVAGVLASLYPATTVLLAALVLREKIHRAQGLGLALCAAAIALVAGG